VDDSITQSIEPLDWEMIKSRLQVPFDPMDVKFRVGRKEGNRVQVLAYIDARCVQDRLDDVVGPQNWSYTWEPVALDAKGNLIAVKGTLSLYGVAKSDLGDASNFEGNKGAVSDAEKRAAVQWGIGRYLYEIEKKSIRPEGDTISPATLLQLRKSLPAPKTHKTIVVEEDDSEAPVVVQQIAAPAPDPDPWEVQHQRALRLGVSEQQWQSRKTQLKTLRAVTAALDAKAQQSDLQEGEQPPSSEETPQPDPDVLAELNTLRMRANALKWSQQRWERLLANSAGDLVRVAEVIKNAEPSSRLVAQVTR
jgi:hypothetical protein